MTAMTFDSDEPAYTSAPVAGSSGDSIFGSTATFERLQGRRKQASKMPYILAGALVVAGLGAYGVSELLSHGAAETTPVAAPPAQILPTEPAAPTAMSPPPVIDAPVASTPPATAARVAPRAAARPAIRPAARTSPAEAGPAVSVAAAPTISAPPLVLSIPAPGPAEASPAQISSPPPINPDPGAAIQ